LNARKYRIAAIGALALVSVLAAVLGGAYVALRQVRPFYDQALAIEPAKLSEGGRELESRASALYSDSRKAGQWRAVFTADQINGWMATQLSQSGTHALPKGIDMPRVAIGEGTISLGFRARHGGVETVVSADASAMVTESGEIAIRIISVEAGSLPIPVLQVADEIAKACQKLSLPIRWTQENGQPVALLTIQQEGTSSRGRLTIDTIELRDGALYVAGHIDEKEKLRSTARKGRAIGDY
jgi:hypothetical protein